MASWTEPIAARPPSRASVAIDRLLAQVMRERYPSAAQVEREVYAPRKRRPAMNGGTTK